MGNDSNHTYFLACAAVFITICPIFVGLRILTRRLQKLSIGIDDWLSVCALVFLLGCGIVMIIGVHHGVFGYPTPTSDPGNQSYRLSQQLEWSFFLLVIPALGCIKLSFIFFFRRIFNVRRGQATFNVVSYIFIVLIILWEIAFFFWFLLSCAPNMAGRWSNHVENNASCPTDEMSDLALAISDVITDVMIFCLPVPSIIRLQMEVKRKIVVLVIFLLGSGALVASIIRLNYFVYVTNVASGNISAPDLDVNLLVTQGLYWSMIEAGLALVCCTLPTLKALPRLQGIRTMIHSVRSALSLGSHGSRGRNSNEQDITWETRKHGGSGSGKKLSDDADGIGLRTLSKGSHETSEQVSNVETWEAAGRSERSFERSFEAV